MQSDPMSLQVTNSDATISRAIGGVSDKFGYLSRCDNLLMVLFVMSHLPPMGHRTRGIRLIDAPPGLVVGGDCRPIK